MPSTLLLASIPEGWLPGVWAGVGSPGTDTGVAIACVHPNLTIPTHSPTRGLAERPSLQEVVHLRLPPPNFPLNYP